MSGDDDLPAKKPDWVQKNLEQMSLPELEAYIKELESEIERVKLDIKSKSAHMDAAAALFKS